MAGEKSTKNNADNTAPKDPKVATKKSTEDIESLRGIAAIGYIGILFLVPLLMHPKSEFCVYHANQSLILLIVAAVGWAVLGAVPIIGWALMPFFSIAVLVFMIIGIVNAVNGRMQPLPAIGQFTILKPQA